MSRSRINTTECELCGDEFTPIEDAWEWQAEADWVAGGSLNNPGRSALDEAEDQLGLSKLAHTCIPCWVSLVQPLAWEIRQAD